MHIEKYPHLLQHSFKISDALKLYQYVHKMKLSCIHVYSISQPVYLANGHNYIGNQVHTTFTNNTQENDLKV